jgi:tetratricopeptide (TPR) repeat protein
VMALSQDMTNEAVMPLLQAAKDDYAIVRIQAGAALARFPASQMDEATRGTVERAVSEYVASLEARPDDFRRHLNLGVLYADRGALQQALDENQLALRLRPDTAESLVNESVVYSRMGRGDEAEEALRRAIQTEPANSAALYNLGLLLAEKNRLPEAEQALRRALDADSSNAAAAYNLCVIVSKSRPAEGIGLCRRAVASAPGNPKYSYTLAYYLAQKGDLPAATAVLKQTVHSGVACPSCDKLLAQIQGSRP